MAASKAATAKGAGRKTAARKSASGGARPATIAGIPITREELEPLLGDEMPLFAYSYACTFASELDLPAMRDRVLAHLGELRAAKQVLILEPTRSYGHRLYVELAYKQVAVTIHRPAGEPDRWVLAALYRGTGEPWGSNHALFLWFVKSILPWVDATAPRIEHSPHARSRP